MYIGVWPELHLAKLKAAQAQAAGLDGTSTPGAGVDNGGYGSPSSAIAGAAATYAQTSFSEPCRETPASCSVQRPAVPPRLPPLVQRAPNVSQAAGRRQIWRRSAASGGGRRPQSLPPVEASHGHGASSSGAGSRNSLPVRLPSLGPLTDLDRRDIWRRPATPSSMPPASVTATSRGRAATPASAGSSAPCTVASPARSGTAPMATSPPRRLPPAPVPEWVRRLRVCHEEIRPLVNSTRGRAASPDGDEDGTPRAAKRASLPATASAAPPACPAPTRGADAAHHGRTAHRCTAALPVARILPVGGAQPSRPTATPRCAVSPVPTCAGLGNGGALLVTLGSPPRWELPEQPQLPSWPSFVAPVPVQPAELPAAAPGKVPQAVGASASAAALVEDSFDDAFDNDDLVAWSLGLGTDVCEGPSLLSLKV
eukprot:NODE_8075_length_1525_cov_5.160944.p1 GENE.NODE_8075_length_1525_cov_5.160944~~NODE_8075_length_1525_cov_5.160944.p1  ORF type:complete len:475 (+),score=107.22 NODE_8075_length_1525_cov_5.160944:149-1426(+)